MKRLCCLLSFAVAGFSQQPAAQTPRPAPKTVFTGGIEIPAADRVELQAGLNRLRAATEKLKGNPLLPDVLIYQEAVRFGLQYNEILTPAEIAKAKTLLAHGEERASQLATGQSPWTTASGLVVRGYISKIDKSVQPYGLVVPPSFSATAPHPWRLDTWFHGRTETLTEINFLSEREARMGDFTPRDTIVLHLYGRFCNASKLAGEVDFFEALDAVKKNYRIDENRILIRGFSMGGASAWSIGTHFAGMWAGVAPGAGFTESAQFLRLKLDGPNPPPAWEQTVPRGLKRLRGASAGLACERLLLRQGGKLAWSAGRFSRFQVFRRLPWRWSAWRR